VELPIGVPRYPGTSVLNYIMGCDDFLNMDIQSEMWSSMTPSVRCKTSSRERALLTLDVVGFPRKQIAKLFNIKVESVRRMVYATKKKLGLCSTIS
jgi:DNA-binding NarL/FixJ family response regulator